MRKSEVSIGRTYAVKVSGRVCPVRLESESGYGGWNGRNLITGRDVRVKTAARLRHELEPKTILEETRRQLLAGGWSDEKIAAATWRPVR